MKKIERIKSFWLAKVKLEFGINVNNEIIAELWILSLTDKKPCYWLEMGVGKNKVAALFDLVKRLKGRHNLKFLLRIVKIWKSY